MFKILFRDSSVYLFANILAASIPFLLLPILTRVLDPGQYGMVAMFLVLVLAMKSIAVTPFIGAINRKYFDKRGMDNYQGFVGSGLLLVIFTITTLSAIIYLLPNFVIDNLGIPSFWVFLVIYVTVNSAIVELVLGQWQMKRDPKKYAKIQVSLSLLNILSSLLLVLYFEWGASGRAYGLVIAYSVIALLCLYTIYMRRFVNFSFLKKKYMLEICKFSIPLIPHMIGGLLLSICDRFVIATKLDLKSVGVYFAALQIVMVAKVIFDALNKAFTPWLYEQLNKNSEQTNRAIVIATYFWFLLIWFGVGICFYLASSITHFILGQSFHNASELLGWLAVSAAFRGMYLMVANYCFYAKRTGYLSAISIVSGCITLALMFYLIDRYGLVGAAYATSLGMGIRFMGIWWLANKCHHMPWFKVFKMQRKI